MKINNLLILAAAPVASLALPANITHAPQSDAPVPANHHDWNVKIGLGCFGAVALASYVGLNIHRGWLNE